MRVSKGEDTAAKSPFIEGVLAALRRFTGNA